MNKPTEHELKIIDQARTIIESYDSPWDDKTIKDDILDRLTEYVIYTQIETA